ncbi:hypothetical protein [Bacillus sp. E214]|uniref:hypothetical protein n=1 Tax=Bacillus sp. E214 TaxID=2587156 RepID=UPI0016529469|nr:hypothetical protein [Bacillus sp. E214]
MKRLIKKAKVPCHFIILGIFMQRFLLGGESVYGILILLKIEKRLKPLIPLGLSLLVKCDPDWVRTSDPHPVKKRVK